MMIKYLSQLESDTITEQPVKIDFEFSNRESIPEGKKVGDSITIEPITVRTWFRIRPLLLQIDKKDFDKMIYKKGEKKEITKDLPDIMSKYSDLLLDIVCLGIHNKKTVPPQWFREVLMDNSTWEDIRILLNAVLYRIGFFPFCESITLLRNVSPLKTETEKIAVQNLTSWRDLVKRDSSLTCMKRSE